MAYKAKGNIAAKPCAIPKGVSTEVPRYGTVATLPVHSLTLITIYILHGHMAISLIVKILVLRNLSRILEINGIRYLL